MGAQGSISLTFSALSLAQASAIIAAAAANGAPATVAAPAAPAAPVNPTPAQTVAPAPQVAPVQPAPAPAAQNVTSPSSVTLQQVVEAAKTFATTPGKGGAAKLKEVFAQYGATNATNLAPENYANVIAALQA